MLAQLAQAANYQPVLIIGQLVYEPCMDNFHGLCPLPLPLNSSVDCCASILPAIAPLLVLLKGLQRWQESSLPSLRLFLHQISVFSFIYLVQDHKWNYFNRLFLYTLVRLGVCWSSNCLRILSDIDNISGVKISALASKKLARMVYSALFIICIKHIQKLLHKNNHKSSW